jgi:hypothetical protein
MSSILLMMWMNEFHRSTIVCKVELLVLFWQDSLKSYEKHLENENDHKKYNIFRSFHFTFSLWIYECDDRLKKKNKKKKKKKKRREIWKFLKKWKILECRVLRSHLISSHSTKLWVEKMLWRLTNCCLRLKNWVERAEMKMKSR